MKLRILSDPEKIPFSSQRYAEDYLRMRSLVKARSPSQLRRPNGSTMETDDNPISPVSELSDQQQTPGRGTPETASGSDSPVIICENLAVLGDNFGSQATPTTAVLASERGPFSPSRLEAVVAGSIDSSGNTSSSPCSSPDCRWALAGDPTGATSTPTRVTYSHLVDCPSMSPHRSLPPRRKSSQSHMGRLVVRRQSRDDPCELPCESPVGRFSSPENAPSPSWSSPTGSPMSCAESAGSKDSQQSKEAHRRGRPRADQLATLISEGSTSPSNIKCTICHRVFPREKSRQAHERIHRGDKPYVCDYPGCTKAFAQTGQLNTHQRLHTGEKPFLCSEPGCNVRFTHSNRHCPDHPTSLLIRTPLSAIKPVTENLSPAVKAWLEKYHRAKNDKTPNSNKRPKSRKSSEIKSEQENVYGRKRSLSTDNEEDSQDEDDVLDKPTRRPTKTRKNLEMGTCVGLGAHYVDDYNHNYQRCQGSEDQDSQDNSLDENQVCLPLEEDEMRESPDEVKDVLQESGETRCDSEYSEAAMEYDYVVARKPCQVVKPLQNEEFEAELIDQSLSSADDRHVEPSETPEFEDDEQTLVDPRSPPMYSTLESESDESTLPDVQLITPQHRSRNISDDIYVESPHSQKVDRHLPSTPVSRMSRCLPLKKRWVCMSSQHEALSDLRDYSPLAQPISWDPHSEQLMNDLHNSTQWSLSRSQHSFLNLSHSSEDVALNLATSPSTSNSSSVQTEVAHSDYSIPMSGMEVEEELHGSPSHFVTAKPSRNIQSGNEGRASVLRHVGINRVTREVDVSQMWLDNLDEIEGGPVSPYVQQRFTFNRWENVAVMALLDLRQPHQQDSESSHEEA